MLNSICYTVNIKNLVLIHCTAIAFNLGFVELFLLTVTFQKVKI